MPADGGTAVVLVNSDASTGVNATVDIAAAVSSASAVYLRGGALDATTGITLGQAAVTQAGTWSPQPPYTLATAGTTLTLPIPAASAVLITVR